MKHLFVPLELKTMSEAGAFTGYAAVFEGIDSQGDSVRRGAFARSLAEHKTAGTMPPLLWMHDASKPVGTLRHCSEDAKGLRVAGRLTLGVGQADEAYALMRDGAVTGLSIGYRARQSHRDAKSGARVLSDVDLREISLVALPANPAARVDQVKGLVGVSDLLAAVRQNKVFLASALELKRRVLTQNIWAPPLLWGPWTRVDDRVGNNRYTISATTISDAPSSFAGEVRYWNRDGRQVVEAFGDSVEFSTEDSANAIYVRFKSHSLGQVLRVTIEAFN